MLSVAKGVIADAGGAVGAREGVREGETAAAAAAATYEAAKWSAINRTEWPLFLWAAAAVNVHKTGPAGGWAGERTNERERLHLYNIERDRMLGGRFVGRLSRFLSTGSK